jgi:hypothetical protein
VHYGANGIFIWVVLVIEHHARPKAANTMASFTRVIGAYLVCLNTARTSWRDWPIKEIWLKIGESPTFGTDHLLEATMQLHGSWPRTLLRERNLGF